MRKNSRPPAPAVCPVCGEDVPPRSRACPECGADHESGWREGSEVDDGLGLPADEFDYGTFAAEEFGGASPKPGGIRWIWWITAVVLVIFLIWGWFSLLH